MDFFPFTVYCGKWYNDEGGSSIRHEFAALWQKTRPVDMSWYAVNVEVLGPSRLRFVAYDMQNYMYGGIGSKIGEYSVAGVSPEIMRAVLQERAMEMAKYQRRRELERAENDLLRDRANDMLTAVLGDAASNFHLPERDHD